MDMPFKFPIDAFPWRLSLVLLLPWLAGCGNGLVSVSGTVRLDGKPVAEAGVVFHPVEGGAPASGVTDAQGRYQLSAGSRPGALAGEYRVTVSKQRTSGIGENELPLPGGIKIQLLVPQKYGNPQTSPLRATVGRGSANHDFDLSSH